MADEPSAEDLADLRLKAARYDEAVFYIFMMMDDGLITDSQGEIPPQHHQRHAMDALNLVKILRGDPERPFELAGKATRD